MEMWKLVKELKELSDCFYDQGIEDVYTNSKIFEVLMSEQFGHEIINGHAKSLDAKDSYGNLYEYKHFKVSSSNHTWTFNDFSTTTIEKLYDVQDVYFAIVDDKPIIPEIVEVYIVNGVEVAKYLEEKTQQISNHRKMINISRHQIITSMNYDVIYPDKIQLSKVLQDVFYVANEIEKITGVEGILTSNKLWELLVASRLGHYINPEQRKHDAYDKQGRTYEYKVSKNPAWKFQDISENVLQSYLNDEKIILAVVDKKNFVVTDIYICNPEVVVLRLRCKLEWMLEQTDDVRRLQATINLGDIRDMINEGDAEWLQ